jgi:hypothetical protein
MSKTILAEVNGWTPIIDSMVRDVGLTTAIVFGKMWRYCQMVNCVCEASQEKIASELGISRATVNKHIEALVIKGYLIDTTPGLVGMPHKYKDTGKAGIVVSISAEPVKKLDLTCKDSLHLPVKKFDTKIVLKDSIKDTTSFSKNEKEEPTIEPCNDDGIPDSWREVKTRKPNISENEQRLAKLIADTLGIKPPICNTKKEYAAAQVTWWKPIKEMLRQVDQNIQEAESIADCAIEDFRKARLTMTSPKSVLSGFIAVLVREKNGH